jgi:signal transduction histidine kinase/ligand-binding sensor domain-containing protein
MRAMRTARARTRRVVALALAFAGVLAWCPSAFALNTALDISQYAHTAWKIREGFSKGRVTSIAQTPDGYLWLGTEFGLLRFDGIRHVLWQPPAGESFRSSFIRTLFTARDGTLWIGTLKELASLRDGQLTRHKEFDGWIVDSMSEDREGTVWAGGQTASTGRLCAIHTGSVRCFGEDGSLGRGTSLHQDSKGNLWVVAVPNAVWRWTPGTPKRYSLPDPISSTIQVLTEGDNDALLIATVGGIRQVVDGKDIAFPLITNRPQARPTRLLRDRNGGLWIGTFDSGLLHVHQGRTDVFARSEGLSGDSINRLFEDREGNIWVATLDGLDRFREAAAATFSVSQGLSNTPVESLLAARDGNIWLGTPGGLNRWNRGQMTVYRGPAHRSVQGPPPRTAQQSAVHEIVASGLPKSIGSLFQDDRGRIWIGTPEGAGYLENDRLISVDGVPGGIFDAITEDNRANLWFLNRNLGLFRLSPSREVQQIPWASLGHDDPASRLAADPLQGGLWLGFSSGGVAYFADGQVRASYTSADGLGEGHVNYLGVDRDGALWAATEGGLSRLKNGRVATLTSKNGLPCDAVDWMVEDDADSLWLYTACGFVRMARSELVAWAAAVDQEKVAKWTIQATVFDSSDGVRSVANKSSFSPHVAKAADGKLWFATVDGVSVVDPRHLPFNSLLPPVHIEQIAADRRAYEATPAGNGRVQLPPLIRDLQIDYTALSLVAPEKNRFKVKLEGRDRDWQDVGTRRQAYYTDLSPGNYRLRVVASNNSGAWNETGAALDFSVAPAYYQTIWFRTLAVATFLSLLWAAHRTRLRIVERHEAEISALNERLMKAQEQERTRIAGELHDGVMQQISALSLVLGTGKRQPEADAKQTMADVQRKLIEVGAEVRQLSHNLHPPTLKDAGLPEALRGYCEDFSHVRGIAVTCDADDRVQDLSRGAALAVYRIAQEAMGNAVTHGAARHVDVRLARSNGLVALTVTDDGKGFDANRIGGSRGLGLINMRERARQLNGTFELNSEPGRGTTVVVTIPFRRAV